MVWPWVIPIMTQPSLPFCLKSKAALFENETIKKLKSNKVNQDFESN